MYNFDFLKNEELIEIFEDVWIVQGNNEKCTTIALTNQRLLFLDYDKYDYIVPTLTEQQIKFYIQMRQMY